MYRLVHRNFSKKLTKVAKKENKIEIFSNLAKLSENNSLPSQFKNKTKQKNSLFEYNQKKLRRAADDKSERFSRKHCLNSLHKVYSRLYRTL